ncbi:ATP-binding cassette domain-containing protein [Microbacterium sp. KSW4-16]|uniref:ATP-binding cassette domain-containing protein n=1 Tax=Microbacterium aurugineum TaxID=2851642 RepID=A0ABY4J4T3_9MICO|nr:MULTISPECIES: ATP-binding cassette domain-containing protein [Microbacterium]MCK8467572.1 ATP-binding cassette domain-containing protein [Microbacterium aurugineum]TCJ22957.1 ABC transporter ATP-binding protein [Microbacterium sp. PI-1]UPL19167.1 ATP-binding cassette domain-containing protein [Microbacterium aurugineum]
MSLVEVSDLYRAFRMGPGTERVVAVNNVSFAIDAGEALGLVGESGSGKSTIARILVGLERADAGSAVIDGVDRLRRPRGRAERLARARAVQMVFQDPNGSLDRRLTVRQTLRRTLRLREEAAGPHADRTIAELLDRVRLTERHADAKPHELSGGQRQRVAIARALAVSPRLVVLDEAVSALDVSVQAQVLELLAEIQRESRVSYLFVSHDLAVVRELCSRVLVLFRGAVVEQGDTERVLTHPEHPYSQLLIASTPGPGWDPERVVRDRMTFTQRMEVVGGGESG